MNALVIGIHVFFLIGNIYTRNGVLLAQGYTQTWSPDLVHPQVSLSFAYSSGPARHIFLFVFKILIPELAPLTKATSELSTLNFTQNNVRAL